MTHCSNCSQSWPLLNGAVDEIVKQMVKNLAFEAAIQEKLNASMDTAELEIRIHNIREQRITSERTYEFLQMYDIVYDKFSDAEKLEEDIDVINTLEKENIDELFDWHRA